MIILAVWPSWLIIMVMWKDGCIKSGSRLLCIALVQLACPVHPTTIQGPFWNVTKDHNFTAILPQFYRNLSQFFRGRGDHNSPPPRAHAAQHRRRIL